MLLAPQKSNFMKLLLWIDLNYNYHAHDALSAIQFKTARPTVGCVAYT